MRIARFSDNGTPKYGVVDGPELAVLSGHPLVDGYETSGERVAIKEVKLLSPTLPLKDCLHWYELLGTRKRDWPGCS